MKKRNRHHNLPLSLGGRDKDCNIIVIDLDDHKQIHDTLDIPYNTVRKYRAVMNFDMFNLTRKKALAQARIEELFFARIGFLPARIQLKIKDKFEEDTRDLFNTHGEEFGNSPRGSLLEVFSELLKRRKALYIHLCGGQPLI